MRDMLKSVVKMEYTENDIDDLLRHLGTNTDNVAQDKKLSNLVKDTKAYMQRLADLSDRALEKGGELRVLAEGRLASLLATLRFDADEMFNPASNAHAANPTHRHRMNLSVPQNITFGGKAGIPLANTAMVVETSTGQNLRRVTVVRAGRETSTFLLAVQPHPGSRKRAATAANVEVAGQLFRDLVAGVTHLPQLAMNVAE